MNTQLIPCTVCAEAYNPDDDDDEGVESKVVHHKTEEQLRRLQDACRDILLFKTLEEVYCQQTNKYNQIKYTQ